MNIYSGPEASELFKRYLSTISDESDRGAVLVAASLLDEGLERVLKGHLLVADRKDDPLFDRGFAPLRSFSAKIELAFRLGLITREVRGMFNLLRDLRNEFAHGAEPVTLHNQSVKDRLRVVFERNVLLHQAIVIIFEEIIKTEPDITFSLDQFLTTERGQRAIFNTFFAANAMALHRTALTANRVTELEQT